MPRTKLVGLRQGSPKDILVASFEIEHEEVLHLKEFYKYLHDYICTDEGFKSYWDDDKPETLYWERQNATGNREHQIWWRFYQYPNENKYYRIILKLDFQTLNVGKKEIMRNNQKFKLDEGDIIVRVQSYVQLDYNEEWKDHWLLKHFDETFRSRIYKSQIDMIKLDLYKTTYRINNIIKQFLQLSTVPGLPPAWQPAKGMR